MFTAVRISSKLEALVFNYEKHKALGGEEAERERGRRERASAPDVNPAPVTGLQEGAEGGAPSQL